MQDYAKKSTVEEIRKRFDGDVERFSNLQTGQTATIDAPLAMDLITQAAVAVTPQIRHVLDIGCGAGNNTLKLLASVTPASCTLLDLSAPMLQRAEERVRAVFSGTIATVQADLREAELAEGTFDVILAAAVLHHLRDEEDWRRAFARLYALCAPGGSVWITDLVSHEHAAVQEMMWGRYGDYLQAQGGEEYRQKVFAYIDQEDTPRPVSWQMELLRKVGFRSVDILHKNSCFAAYGAVR